MQLTKFDKYWTWLSVFLLPLSTYLHGWHGLLWTLSGSGLGYGLAYLESRTNEPPPPEDDEFCIDGVLEPLDFETHIIDAAARYGIQTYYSADDDGFIATVREFPGLRAFGETIPDAIAEAWIALAKFIKLYIEQDIALPEPVEPPPAIKVAAKG